MTASNTLLKYELQLGYRGERADEGPLEIKLERLTHIIAGDAHEMIRFDNSAQDWRNRVVVAKRRSKKGNGFIETGVNGTIRVHQDQKAGMPQERLAATLPRTVLSSVNASESPTVVVARNEMASWRFLQFEPTALRSPDPFRADRAVGANGSHLAAAFVDVCADEWDEHIVRQQDVLTPKTAPGRFTVGILRLDRPELTRRNRELSAREADIRTSLKRVADMRQRSGTPIDPSTARDLDELERVLLSVMREVVSPLPLEG